MAAQEMSFDPGAFSVRELRSRLLDGDSPFDPAMVSRLQRDPRLGARSVGSALQRRQMAERSVAARIEALRERERALWSVGLLRVAGVDEAGLGPLAGPVVAAAVVFAPEVEALPVDDSKRLSPAVRERLAARIHAAASGVGIGLADVHEIDMLNVHQAGLLAMRRAVEALPEPPEHLLVDARRLAGVRVPQEAIVGGDARCHAIAAASIVAKTHRDCLMSDLDRSYPAYGFARHKGYATEEHVRALRAHGPCPEHRASYACLDGMTGRGSDAFHDLRRRLEVDATPAALDEVEAALTTDDGSLGEFELRRLRVLLRRRRGDR